MLENVKFSEKFYVWNPISETADKLADMSHKRYSHMSTYFLGKLFVFGGMDE